MKKFTKFMGIAMLSAAIIAPSDATSLQAKGNQLNQAVLEKLKGNPAQTAFTKPAVKANSPLIQVANTSAKTNFGTKAIEGGVSTIGPASQWQTIDGPDGNMWLLTQEFVYNNYQVTSSTVTFYDETGTQVGELTITPPADEYANDIQILYINNTFFDSNSSTYEVTTYTHFIGDDYSTYGRFEIYSLTDGTLLKTIPGSVAMYVSHTANYSTYQRYLICDQKTGEDGESYINVDVYAPVSWQSEEPTIEHTFSIPYENLNYSDGPYVNTYFLNDELYIALSQYEKPYMDNSTMELTPDNHYLVNVYDNEYNEVAALSIPVETASGMLFSMYAMGYFSYEDLSIGSYSGDDKFNFIITRYDYTPSAEDFLYSFFVYDQDGNLINTIDEEATAWSKLSPISGEETQYAMIHTYGDSESIKMVNLPSCETVTTFPGYLDGNLLSSNLDRYPVNDTYQYVIPHGNGYDDGNGNTVTRIGWYNIDQTLDHYVDINLGPNATLAQHVFMTNSLDPYLFNCDDEHEYILLVTTLQDDGTSTISLCIANDSGEIIRQFGADETKGNYNYGYLINTNSNGKNSLLVGYVDDNWQYIIDTYELPFSKFEGGGDGTESNPYIISTAGDLNYVRDTPSAYYALGNDIDMSTFYGDFEPIADFTGSLDGKGYSIDNLSIAGSDMEVGLFQGIASDGTIKDVTFNNPVVKLSGNCMYAGVVAGNIMSNGGGYTISNVHVNNAVFTSDGSVSPSIGGIAGQLTIFSKVSDCSVNNINIDVPEASNVGGIVGTTRTSSSVSASRASGTINAGTTIGGIVGDNGTGGSITNCYADMQITGENEIGGIVGATVRGASSTTSTTGYASAVSNSYATGSITATTPNKWTGNFSVGGIAGSITSNWGAQDCDYSIYNCLAALDAINLPEDTEEALAVGRIIGFTIANEDYMEGEEVLQDAGLVNNYAVASMTVNGSTITSDDATTPQGADIAADAINTDFFTTTLGFAFGSTTDEPWKATTELPILYFEQRATGITLDVTSAAAGIDNLITITATVEGTTADRVAFTSSDEEVASVIAIAIDGNTATATVRCHTEGSAEITAEIDGLTATCTLDVTTSVEAIETSQLRIYTANGSIFAPSATNIAVYSIGGAQVANVNAESIEAGVVANGIYIVVATDATGNRAVEKVIMK